METEVKATIHCLVVKLTILLSTKKDTHDIHEEYF